MARKPTSAQRRRTHFMARLDATSSAVQRMSAAWDYLRAVLRAAPDREEADQTAEGVTTYLLTTAQRVQAKGDRQR